MSWVFITFVTLRSSDIKEEVHYISVLDNVVLSLYSQLFQVHAEPLLQGTGFSGGSGKCRSDAAR